MKKILVLILTFFISTAVNADVTSQALNKVAEKISDLIPGEGITEVSLDYNDGDEDQLNFSILGVRDIEATDNSNFFTQFSLMNQEINSSGRIIGNIGLGYRKLLDYSKSYGLSLGKKFKETIEPLGKVDGQEIFALLEKFEKVKR